MLYGCATWTMRSRDFSSLRTAHHKLLLRIIGFRRKDRTGYKPLSYGEVLERTSSERIKTTIRKRLQLGFAGPLVRQGDSRLSKRVMLGRLAVQGPRRGGRPATSWVGCLQKNLEALGEVPCKGKMTEVGRIRSCCQGWTGLDDCCEERGHVTPGGREWSGSTLDNAWRRADLSKSNVWCQCEAREFVQ